MAKEKEANQIWDLYPPKALSKYQGKNGCNYFLSDVHAFEQKNTQNMGSRQPILLLFRTSDYNVTIMII